jgi:hypothetical protein
MGGGLLQMQTKRKAGCCWGKNQKMAARPAVLGLKEHPPPPPRVAAATATAVDPGSDGSRMKDPVSAGGGGIPQPNRPPAGPAGVAIPRKPTP